MILLVDRFGFGFDSTLSCLWDMTHEGVVLASSLEDERRDTKLLSETCIPLGTYTLGLKTHGGFHDRYRRRFRDLHIGMIEVLDVPGFTDILWHCGNDDDDTAGCLLIGSYPVITPDGEFEILQSVKRYKIVYPLVANAIAKGTLCEVTYVERKPAA